jgi:heme exporter protein D
MAEFFNIWWADWPAFVQMGRHGPYVWGSVACLALGLALEQLALRQRARRLKGGAR